MAAPLAALAVAVVVAATPANAQSDEELCVMIDGPDPDLNAALCAELRNLIFAPYAPRSLSRSAGGSGPSTAQRKAIKSFEILDEAYRADPERALKLIDDILSAGGLAVALDASEPSATPQGPGRRANRPRYRDYERQGVN